jgi:hypothetical protein
MEGFPDVVPMGPVSLTGDTQARRGMGHYQIASQ